MARPVSVTGTVVSVGAGSCPNVSMVTLIF